MVRNSPLLRSILGVEYAKRRFNMINGALAVLCGIVVLIVMLFATNLRKSFMILFLGGFGIGFLVEFAGTQRNHWGYAETDMFMFFNIPFEILIFYGTGLMLLGILTLYLVQNNKDEKLYEPTIKLTFLIGVILLVAHLFGIGTAIFPMTFFAIWGVCISKQREIPIFVGIVAFLTDFAVEGGLLVFTNYYGWTMDVALSFMLFAIAFVGYLTAGD